MTTNSPLLHENGIINFIAEHKKERVAQLLADPKRRQKILNTLAHEKGMFDRAVIVPVPEGRDSAAGIYACLKDWDAPEDCYLISEDAEWDGKHFKLAGIIGEVMGTGMGTIVSCIPGQLAFYEGERRDRFFLINQL
jgi:hypothetical protein